MWKNIKPNGQLLIKVVAEVELDLFTWAKFLIGSSDYSYILDAVN